MLKFLDRLRGGTNIVVVVEVEGQIGLTIAENDSEECLSNAVNRASAKVLEKTRKTIDLIGNLSDLGGKQLIKNTADSEEVNKLNSLCTDKQANVINALCSELGIDAIEVKDSMNLAGYYCLKAALETLLTRS